MKGARLDGYRNHIVDGRASPVASILAESVIPAAPSSARMSRTMSEAWAATSWILPWRRLQLSRRHAHESVPPQIRSGTIGVSRVECEPPAPRMAPSAQSRADRPGSSATATHSTGRVGKGSPPVCQSGDRSRAMPAGWPTGGEPFAQRDRAPEDPETMTSPRVVACSRSRGACPAERDGRLDHVASTGGPPHAFLGRGYSQHGRRTSRHRPAASTAGSRADDRLAQGVDRVQTGQVLALNTLPLEFIRDPAGCDGHLGGRRHARALTCRMHGDPLRVLRWAAVSPG